MAERIHKRHQDDIRAKIQASVLIDMLTHFAADNEIKERLAGGGSAWREAKPEDAPLMGQRIRAALGLLNKTIPDLTRTELSGDPENPLKIEKIERVIVDPAANP